MLNVNRRTFARIFQFLESNPGWIRYSRRTLIPDESFFTSIIANDPDLRVCNDVLRYIKWPRMHASSGSAIEADDLEEILNLPALPPFALKFDSREHPEALDRVDALFGLEHHECGMKCDQASRQVEIAKGSLRDDS